MMNRRNILLVSKEILRKDMIGAYGGKIKTPHIDALAEEGTLFDNYYAAGCSTAMAVTTMFSGLNPFEITGRDRYREVEAFNQTETLFQRFNKEGYECHVVWPRYFDEYVEKYIKIFNSSVTVHPLYAVSEFIPSTRDWLFYKAIERYNKDSKGADIYLYEIRTIMKKAQKKVFIWLHLPHVLCPFTAYGEDIEVFDEVIGVLRRECDADIFVTADHGQVKGEKPEHGYGFTIYEGAANIPLITPRLPAGARVDYPVGADQLMSIIMQRNPVKKEFVYSDTQYYKQPDRVLMIRSDMYKYIFNKKTGFEELYDLEYDPGEFCNLLTRFYYSIGRNIYYPFEELFYYPHWKRAEAYYRSLSAELRRIWKTGSMLDNFIAQLRKLKSHLSWSSIRHACAISRDIRKHGSGRWHSHAAIKKM